MSTPVDVLNAHNSKMTEEADAQAYKNTLRGDAQTIMNPFTSDADLLELVIEYASSGQLDTEADKALKGKTDKKKAGEGEEEEVAEAKGNSSEADRSASSGARSVIQFALQQRSEIQAFMSQTAKMIHDSAMSVIRNIRN